MFTGVSSICSKNAWSRSVGVAICCTLQGVIRGESARPQKPAVSGRVWAKARRPGSGETFPLQNGEENAPAGILARNRGNGAWTTTRGARRGPRARDSQRLSRGGGPLALRAQPDIAPRTEAPRAVHRGPRRSARGPVGGHTSLWDQLVVRHLVHHQACPRRPVKAAPASAQVSVASRCSGVG